MTKMRTLNKLISADFSAAGTYLEYPDAGRGIFVAVRELRQAP